MLNFLPINRGISNFSERLNWFESTNLYTNTKKCIYLLLAQSSNAKKKLEIRDDKNWSKRGWIYNVAYKFFYSRVYRTRVAKNSNPCIHYSNIYIYIDIYDSKNIFFFSCCHSMWLVTMETDLSPFSPFVWKKKIIIKIGNISYISPLTNQRSCKMFAGTRQFEKNG